MILLNHDRCALIQGETIATLAVLPSKSFDIILTDPPYSPHVHENLGKERRNDGHAARDELTFPPITPEMIDHLAAEYVRLCRGWILSFSDFFTSARWGSALVKAGGAWVRTGAWVKTNPMPQMTGDRPACGHEDIVIGHAQPKSWSWNGKGHAAIWRGPRDLDSEHPNQKPAWLCQALLGMFAPAGARVLDPFFGSGSIAAGALAGGRIVGEVVVETACKACAHKRAEEYAPPLPVNLSVLGIEGDPKWNAVSISRIGPLLPASIAA